VAELKFGRLPPGGHFRWKNREWQKTSPILACARGEDNPVLVPRSALVEFLDEQTSEKSAGAAAARIDPIMKDLQGKLQRQLETSDLSPDQRKELLLQMGLLIEQAGNRLRESLQD
jgi:hypothetical protein